MGRVRPRFVWYPHCVALAGVLQRVADDELHRVMVFEPPRHGKSEEVSRLFSAYYLYRHPSRFVGLTSYAAALAYTLSRAARENYKAGGGACKDDADAVQQWETPQGGGLWAAGVGGPITGKGFHLGIIDDPNKNAEEAASETVQAGQREWYRSTFYTRQEPGAAIIMVLTRWNERDLAGWQLEEEADEDNAERWHIVHFEAIKEEGRPQYPATCTLEPDPRPTGDALCPERYPLEKLKRLATKVGAYFWNALFQQRPRPREGGMLKRHFFEIVQAVPAGCRRVRYWDKAATEGGGDWTVGLLMAADGEGRFYIEDVGRGQWSSGARDKVIRQTAEVDATRYGLHGVEIWGEQEPGSAGKDAALAFVRLLAGFTAHTETATGSKVERAGPFASQAEAGNVKLVAGPWNRAFIDEATSFPHGSNDDQVDAASGAFNKLATPEPFLFH